MRDGWRGEIFFFSIISLNQFSSDSKDLTLRSDELYFAVGVGDIGHNEET
jgi:hypothetical protein